MLFAGLTCSSSGCASASPGFFSQCRGCSSVSAVAQQLHSTAAPGSWRNALVSETKLQGKCSVTLSESSAVVIWDRVQLSLCDQIAFVRFSDNNLHRAHGWFSSTLCAAMGKEHWEPTLKFTISTPVTAEGQASSRLVWKLMCPAEWRRSSWTIWESDVSIHSLIWGFDCHRGSLRLWEQGEIWIGRVAVSAGMGHPEHWAELTVCCSSPPFITLLSNAVLLEQKRS